MRNTYPKKSTSVERSRFQIPGFMCVCTSLLQQGMGKKLFFVLGSPVEKRMVPECHNIFIPPEVGHFGLQTAFVKKLIGMKMI